MRLGWEMFFKGFLDRYLKDRHVEISLCLDKSVEVRTNLILEGSDRIRLAIVNGIIDCTPLVDADDPLIAGYLDGLQQVADPSAVPIDVLLRFVRNGGRKMFWLNKQLLYWITALIDGTVTEENHVLTDDPSAVGSDDEAMPELREEEEMPEQEDDVESLEFLQNDRQRQAAARKAKEDAALATAAADDEGHDQIVLRYYFSCRRHFRKWRHVCVAFDASTIGQVCRMLGCLSMRGICAWMPPTEPPKTKPGKFFSGGGKWGAVDFLHSLLQHIFLYESVPVTPREAPLA